MQLYHPLNKNKVFAKVFSLHATRQNVKVNLFCLYVHECLRVSSNSVIKINAQGM
ncbi:unnamed protein product [Schistosoma curassoni]|uniref:Uncharacterized protein n=1 Tax=Schistosoma curassoni TaxID=6186 RepID=A0A183L607_9TREM|nr:unnamed protein product [Schistosoma curassoni]